MSAPRPHRPLGVRAANRIGSALGRLGLALPSLDEGRLIRAARRATGLDDFGDDHFREGLSRLLRSLEEDARLNTMGRIMAQRTVLGYLKNRLLLRDHRKKHPNSNGRRSGGPSSSSACRGPEPRSSSTCWRRIPRIGRR